MTTTQNPTTAADLKVGQNLVRVIKNPGRTRVFESDVNETITDVHPHADYPGYVVVHLGASHRLNLETSRAVVVAA